MSKLKTLVFSKEIPLLQEWSKSFRYRNASPRITLANPSIAGIKVKKKTFLYTDKPNIFGCSTELGAKNLNLPNVNNMTAVELYPGKPLKKCLKYRGIR